MLEKETEALTIQDAKGLDRFKSGFFVDNFKTHQIQDQSNQDFSCSIDTFNGELRPSHFTTEVDLLIGSRSLIGIGTTAANSASTGFATDIIGSNFRRTGQVITTDYIDQLHVQNTFATRVENVTPYLVITYTGNIDLFPSSDIWIDQVRLAPQRIEVDDYTATRQQLNFAGFDAQTGLGPIRWGAWAATWTGSSTNVGTSTRVTGSSSRNTGRAIVTNTTRETTTTTTVTRTGVENRSGSRLRVSEQVQTINEGDRVVSSDVIHS